MIKYLLEKEFKQLLRNPMLPRMLLVFRHSCKYPWLIFVV